MDYERINWLNEGEAGAKPINKDNLNKMDEAISYLFENGAGSGDTLPFGAIVEYDGTEVPVGYEEVEENEVVLFEGDSNEDITLSDSASNYEYIELFYYENTLNYSSTKIHSPNGKRACLLCSYVAEDGTFYLKAKDISISDKTISVVGYGESYIASGVCGTAKNNNIKITRVVGHK